MRKVYNHLVQLQELVLIREQEAFMGGERLQQLDEAIKNLTDQLPDDIRTMLLKLLKKDSVAVVPISKGGCSICGMQLPISLVHAVRAATKVYHCPNCTRMLYFSDAPVRSVAQRQSRTEARKSGIERFSAPALMVPRMESKDSEGAIRELAGSMEAGGFVECSEKLVEEAMKREAIIPTTVDHGLAFPHVRGVEGGGLSLALGLSPKGFRFCEQEKQLTRIVFFIVIPTAANAFYLKLLAGLAETFMDADARAKLLAEHDPNKLWKALKKLTKHTIP